jgi:hypothetical protein
MIQLRAGTILSAVLLVAAVCASRANAQQRTIPEVELDAGAWRLTGRGAGVSRSAAPYVGLRVQTGGEARMQWRASVAYLWKDDAQTVRTSTPDGVRTEVYGNTFLPVTAGGSYAVITGATNVRIGIETGFVMTRSPLLRSDGPAPFGAFPHVDHETGPVVVPDIAVTRHWGRLGVRGEARLLAGGASAGGVPMLGLGFEWNTARSRR